MGARRRADVEWVEGRAAGMTWDQEYDLAVMASNVFQVEAWYGDWSRGPLTSTSGNLVVMAAARSSRVK